MEKLSDSRDLGFDNFIGFFSWRGKVRAIGNE